MSNRDIAQEWFKVAETDLSAAAYLLGMRPIPVEVICYHSQQTAEKFLKGYLAFQGAPIRKTHDLLMLCKLCQAFEPNFHQIENECIDLTDYGVNIRYPFEMEVNETDAKTALENARLIGDFVVKLCI
jgi:HEPN domain-containing protein